VASRLTKLAPAVAWAVAGAVAVRHSRRGWSQEALPALSAPAARSAPAPAGVDAGPPKGEEEPIPVQTGEGPGPNSPLDLPAPDWKASDKRAVKEFKEDRGTLTGAGMAFYWFLAIFPAIVAAVGMLGLVNVSAETVGHITSRVTRALPGGASSLFTGPIQASAERGGSLIAVLFGVAAALWSASSGMVGLQMGLDVAYDVKDDRNFLKKRLVAFELLLALLVLGGLATAFIVFGAPLGHSLRDNLPFGSAFVVLWTVVRFVVGLAALTGLFATVYFLAPNRDTPRWVWVSPGGILAALIWLVASVGFSVYVNNFGKYAQTYGSLAGVVVLLLWLYLTALAVILGGELNAELERQSAARKGQVASEP
jgi:membrane protein